VRTYDLYLLGHVAAVVVWAGSGFLMAVLGARIGMTDDPGRRLGYAEDSEWLGLRLFLPSSALALLFGILLMAEGPWDYGMLWIQLGIGALALSTLLGMAVFAPGWKRVGRLAAEQGVESAEARARIGQLLFAGWIDVGLLAAAIWVMTMKPSGGDATSLVITAAIVVAAVAIGAVLWRRSSSHEEAVVGSPA
jgi:hypothetical protein